MSQLITYILEERREIEDFMFNSENQMKVIKAKLELQCANIFEEYASFTQWVRKDLVK
jgi:hypothetical protein